MFKRNKGLPYVWDNKEKSCPRPFHSLNTHIIINCHQIN